MIAITTYEIEEYGITLPEACIEVSELNTNHGQGYYETEDGSGGQVFKNTIVRFKVWADEDAYLDGKKHITEGQRMIDFTPANLDTVSNIALDLAFPSSIIK